MQWDSDFEVYDFLEGFLDGGPWRLVSVGGGLRGRTFTDARKAQDWALQENAGKRNVYFHINPLRQTPKRGKASKADVKSARWLFIDVDPADGAPLDAERERIYRLLTEDFPASVPEPTCILDSGGGFWALWALKYTTDKIDAERYGRALARKFGADNCFNVDRIARLPGTINYPDAKKQAKGRQAAPARIMLADWGRRYVLSDFPEPAASDNVSRTEPAVSGGGNIRRVDGIEDVLVYRPSATLVKILEQGRNVNAPKAGDDSRSAWVFDASCQLVRMGVPDELVRGILLSDALGISESVREHPKPEYYARRQVSRAHEVIGMDGAAKSAKKEPEKKAKYSNDWTDDDLALRFGSESLKGCAHYVSAWGQWMLWNGVRWRPDERLEVVSKAREFQRKIAAEVPGARKSALSSSRTMRLETVSRSNPGVPVGAHVWDSDIWLLGCPDGVVDLRTGKMRKAERSDFITKQIAASPSGAGGCPLWLAFLDRCFRDRPEIVGFLQRLIGYSLTGSTAENKFAFLFGTGRNGKSVFLNTLSSIFGDYAVASPSSTFLRSGMDGHPTDLAMLAGARLVTANELPAGRSWDEARIKSLTGGDAISARMMRQDFFTFRPQFSLIVAGNHQPSFSGVDEALRRRVVMINFAQTIPESEQDKALPDKLVSEFPAIVRWAIDGCIEWQRRGLIVPASVQADSSDYLDAQDELAEFIDECTDAGAGASVPAVALYAAYRHWAIERGHRQPWAQRGLMRAMRERGFTFEKRKNGQHLLGYHVPEFTRQKAEKYRDASRGT